MFKKHSFAIAFQVDIARQMETPGTLKRIMDAGAEMGYNELFLYGEGSLQYRTHPACSAPWALTQKDFLQLQDYARTQHSMNLVPVIPVLGHASYALKNRELAGMREVKHPDQAIFKCDMRQFCTTNPKSYEVIAAMLTEWALLTSGPYLHIGGDESWNFATCPECRKQASRMGRGRMLADFFNRVNSIVKMNGKRTMLWHDMLFYYDNCLEHLDKDIIICDWHYKPIERHPGISIYNWIKTDFLAAYQQQGLTVYICPKSKCKYYEEADNIKTFIEYSKPHKPAGFLNTTWEMSRIPFASAYPSLAYGAACCNRNLIPDPGDFLKKFAAQHFSAGHKSLPLLVGLFAEVAETRPFTSLTDCLDYQDPAPALMLAAKLEAATKLTRKLRPATSIGREYRRALLLIFQRMSIIKRLHGLINEIGRAYMPGRTLHKSLVRNQLRQIAGAIAQIPAQIRRENTAWNRARPRGQENPVVEELQQAEDAVRTFVRNLRSLLAGRITPAKVFPSMLELTLVNNDCSWQVLTVSVSRNNKKYRQIAGQPQCGPFGRYIKTFALPCKPRYIRLEVSGLGQVMAHYLRVIGPHAELTPKRILSRHGKVRDADHLLGDDFRPAIFGDVNSRRYFSKGQEQPACSATIEME